MKTALISLTIVLTMGRPISSQTNLTDEEISELIDTHNFWRSEVGVKNKLSWSPELADISMKWALELKSRNCAFEHGPDNGYGENLFKATSGYFTPKLVVDAWASEREYYDYESNTCLPNKLCGHYTQVVWTSTKKVGCAKVVCDGMDVWVCTYDPPGNWEGEKPY